MALPWVRLDTQWPHNPKFLTLVEDKKWRAIAVYMGSLAWSGAQGQAGFIPRSALPMLHGTTKEAAELVSVRLWIPAQGGWDINGWSEYQPTNDEHEERSRKARDAANIRWAKQREGQE
jgi:hypothetical protein